MLLPSRTLSETIHIYCLFNDFGNIVTTELAWWLLLTYVIFGAIVSMLGIKSHHVSKRGPRKKPCTSPLGRGTTVCDISVEMNDIRDKYIFKFSLKQLSAQRFNKHYFSLSGEASGITDTRRCDEGMVWCLAPNKYFYAKLFLYSTVICAEKDTFPVEGATLISRFMGPTWGLSGADRT